MSCLFDEARILPSPPGEILAWICDKTQVRALFDLNLNDQRYDCGSKARHFFDGTIIDFSGKTKQEPWIRLHIRWEDNVVTKHHNVQVWLWAVDSIQWVNHSLLPPQSAAASCLHEYTDDHCTWSRTA